MVYENGHFLCESVRTLYRPEIAIQGLNKSCYSYTMVMRTGPDAG